MNPIEIREEPLHDPKALVPEVRIIYINAYTCKRHLGTLRPPILQKLDVRWHERFALIKVTLKKREREQLAERVRITIESTMDKKSARQVSVKSVSFVTSSGGGLITYVSWKSLCFHFL